MKNNLRIFIIMILSLLILAACYDSRQYPDASRFSFDDFKECVELKGDSIAFDDILLKPVKIHLIDSFLITKNRNTEQIYHIFNMQSKEKVGECVSFGIGPNEMIDPTLIPSHDGNIWLLDRNRRVLYICDQSKFLYENKVEVKRAISYKEFCNDIIPFSGGKFLASMHTFAHKRFFLFDANGDTIFTKGDYIPLSSLNTDVEKIEGFVNNLAVNEEGTKVVVAYKRTDLIEFYDADMNLLKRLHGPDHFFPEVHQEGDLIRSNKGFERDGYLYPHTVGERVYVLYSGKVFDPKDTGHYLRNKILVFDWEGNPIKYYQLDTPIFDFVVDEKVGMVYGLTDNPESHIVQFRIK